jgi:cytochrome c
MKEAVIAAALAGLMLAPPAFAKAELAKSKQCMECHAATMEGKGPSFRSIAKLYKGTEKAEERIAEKLKKGGAEHWGPNAMPSAEARGVKISDKEAKQLANWILSHY